MTTSDEALQQLLQGGPLASTLFPPNSRYNGVPLATAQRADGTPLIYLRRRLAPPPESMALLVGHTVVEGDRLDNLANAYLGDPELFWRICDANAAIQPDELTEAIGRRLRITLPPGVPGGLPGG